MGQDCYQWGNQKVYCGKGAKHKAMMQGIAIQSTGWREAEENKRDFEAEQINFKTMPDMGLVFPHTFGVKDGKSDRPLWLRHGHFVIGTDLRGMWKVWDLDRNDWVRWNFRGFPLFDRYWAWKKEDEDVDYSDIQSFEDAIALVDWKKNADLERADKFHKGDDSLAVTFMSKTERRALRMKMNGEEMKMARHPNRGVDWIPIRLVKSKAQSVREELECPCSGEKRFGTLVEAKRHQFYCEKYGFQPPNQLYFTPLSLFVARTLRKKP